MNAVTAYYFYNLIISSYIFLTASLHSISDTCGSLLFSMYFWSVCFRLTPAFIKNPISVNKGFRFELTNF
jgi:hypothetical protein